MGTGRPRWKLSGEFRRIRPFVNRASTESEPWTGFPDHATAAILALAAMISFSLWFWGRAGLYFIKPHPATLPAASATAERPGVAADGTPSGDVPQ
jgi:hypothetical protein